MFLYRRSWWKKQSHRKICLLSRSLLKKGEVYALVRKVSWAAGRVEVTRHVLVRYNLNTVLSFVGGNMGLWLGVGTLQVLTTLAEYMRGKAAGPGAGAGAWHRWLLWIIQMMFSPLNTTETQWITLNIKNYIEKYNYGTTQ